MTTTTPRETADHAELARLAEAAKRVRRDAIGRLDGDDAHRIWFAFVDAVSNPATVLALLSEIAALRGEVGDLTRHRDRLAITCQRRLDDWRSAQAQATQAERQRDKAVGLLEDLSSWFTTKPQIPTAWIIPCGTMGADDAVNAARAFLANQGADQ